jgi:hypothetical protein
MRISLCLLKGGAVVGTDTYEVLKATRTDKGLTLLLDRGTLTLEGQLTVDLQECAQALNQGQYTTTPEEIGDEPN